MGALRLAPGVRPAPGVRLALAVCLALALCVLGGCGAGPAENDASGGPASGENEVGAATVLLDGAPFDGGAVAPDSPDDMRVYITLDGAALIDLPFGETHTVRVTQPDGAENEIALTGAAVFMADSNCDNQDCVRMGEVTRDNYELRVLGGFIICLPHRLSVEVRGE